MDSFHEVEYKYKSDNVKLTDFQNLMEKIGYKKKLDISSWDVYYCGNEAGDVDNFLRLRLSETPELTIKKKTKDNNNFTRIEVDVPLDNSRLTEPIVDKFSELLGYYKSTKLFKSCFVYWQEYINYVFYAVYDKDLNELGRFVEIEINKNSGGDRDHLSLAEKNLATLGITPQHRLKKSLFETYVK